jgi:hypothetical protein
VRYQSSNGCGAGCSPPGRASRWTRTTTCGPASGSGPATRAAIVDALVEDGVHPFDAAVAAAAVLGALTAALLAWATDDASPPLGGTVTAALALLAPAGAP